MAPQAQVGATMRVPSHMTIIAERNMWIIIDTLPPLWQGAHIIVPRRMNHSQGIGEIIIDILHLLHQGAMPKVHTQMSLHQGTPRIVIAMFHLHRLGAMTRVHMHTSLHQGTLRIDIDIHLREIAIAIVHLMIVIVIDMSLPHGTKRTVIVVCPLAHRRSPTHTPSFRLDQDRWTVIAVRPLAHRRSPTHTAPFRLDQDRHMRRPPMVIH